MPWRGEERIDSDTGSKSVSQGKSACAAQISEGLLIESGVGERWTRNIRNGMTWPFLSGFKGKDLGGG